MSRPCDRCSPRSQLPCRCWGIWSRSTWGCSRRTSAQRSRWRVGRQPIRSCIWSRRYRSPRRRPTTPPSSWANGRSGHMSISRVTRPCSGRGSHARLRGLLALPRPGRAAPLRPHGHQPAGAEGGCPPGRALHLGRTIRSGLVAAHHCDNGWCMSPTCLHEASPQENVIERDLRNRRTPFLPRGPEHWSSKLDVADVQLIRVATAAGIASSVLAAQPSHRSSHWPRPRAGQASGRRQRSDGPSATIRAWSGSWCQCLCRSRRTGPGTPAAPPCRRAAGSCACRRSRCAASRWWPPPRCARWPGLGSGGRCVV